jgi:flagellar hook-associated protein FlgK
MDEELARLVLYQQAYSVAARIVRITDELFDELLSIKR